MPSVSDALTASEATQLSNPFDPIDAVETVTVAIQGAAAVSGLAADLAARPPTRLAIDIQTPDGRHFRWGPDEPHAQNVPSGVSFSSTMPGGFEQFSCALPRRADLDYPDLEEFSTVTVYGAGGEIAWQGRLETTPRTSGDQLAITPGAVGWQAALDDEQNARMIYIDSDLSKWQGPSVQRQINYAGLCEPGVSVVTDESTAQPALQVGFQGAWASQHNAEGWYDAKGIQLGALYYAWKRLAVDNTDPNWLWAAALSSDDVASVTDSSGTLRAAGPGTGSKAAAGTRYWAFTSVGYSGSAGSAGLTYAIQWTYLGVVGNHGLTIQGTLGATGGIGVLASDVVAHAVTTWAPELALSRAGQSTIQTSTFIIPQLAFPSPTTASQIITAATQYGLVDWWVDEVWPIRAGGPYGTFNVATRFDATGNYSHGRDWRARVGPSGLQETGPQVDHMYNAVVVAYNDVTGVGRTVGPPGSGADTTDPTLEDTSSSNPVNAAGLDRTYAYSNIGVSTPDGAIAVGQRFLLENAQRNTAGQAQITGHVQDASGVWWPSWAIRAGDRITFTDAHDPVPRRITRTQYNDSSRACQLDLDSPPQDISQLLARYSIALTGLGV